MQFDPVNASLSVKIETNDNISSNFGIFNDKKLQEPIQVSSSSEDADDQSSGDASKQLVVYNPVINGNNEIVPFVKPLRNKARTISGGPSFHLPPRILPSIGAFSVQCAQCFKWRLIPTKEKYEEIREHILEKPFYCETAREWRPDISCNVQADIYQDDSRLWAIDKPNIAQPPRGWQRLLRIRGEGSYKFADVYYQTPSGKRLRSMVEVQRYLEDHPEFQEAGVSISQFSFQTPKPLQENYVRKRLASQTNDLPIVGKEASPLSLCAPDYFTQLQLGRSTLPPPTPFRAPISSPYDRPGKKHASG